MPSPINYQTLLNRRALLGRAGLGLGSLALSSLLCPQILADDKLPTNAKQPARADRKSTRLNSSHRT